MKTTIAISTALLMGAAVSQAGDYTQTTTTQQTTPSYSSVSDPHWFLGGGVDYMFDAEEAFYNGHFGYDFGNGSALFLESGWMGEEQTTFPFLVNIDIDIVPITLNYKYTHMFNDKFGAYAGLGLGASSVDLSAGLASDDDWVFTAQAFAGVVYKFSPSFETYAGVRYMWMDDVSLFGAKLDNLDDVGLGAGIRFNF
ncbi:outer membrane beta-barrel protein [Haloferula sp. BvORR071]|uniref:outer membrane protein n=1 Tax=Haloferula sp. BvORR071 TaxID=1396141 RepID=UPI00054E373C|nr:outer membrane beta-barrel protein [Haloferula sp. BvORR071]